MKTLTVTWSCDNCNCENEIEIREIDIQFATCKHCETLNKLKIELVIESLVW